jgi:hypothetical protein
LRKITKEFIYSSVMLDVIDQWQNISTGCLTSHGSHYSFNSREKISLSGIGDTVKNRPLLIPEMSDIIINSTWWELFKSYWNVDDLKASDIWLGHTDAHLGWYRRLELVSKYKYGFEADGKSFDARLPAFVIK